MSIILRGTTYHADVKVTVKGESRRWRGSTHCQDKVAAQAVHDQIRKQLIDTGVVVLTCATDDTPMTLSQAHERMYREKWGQLAQYRNYQRPSMRHIGALLGKDSPLSAIDNNFLARLKADAEKRGNKPTTINRKLMHLKELMVRARDVWNVEQELPDFDAFRTKGAGKVRERTFTGDESAALLDALKDHDHPSFAAAGDFYRVMAATGARPIELQRLRFCDVDHKDRRVRLVSKKGRKELTRYVALSAEAYAILKARTELGKGTDVVFLDVTRDTRLRAFRWARKELGMDSDEEAVAYTFRHTFATNLLKAGTPLPVIMAILGHSNLQTTQRYLKVDQAQQDEWIAKLNGG